MKRFKDGKMIEVPAEEAEKIKERFSKYRNNRKRAVSNNTGLEIRVEELEKTVAMLVEQLPKVEQ